MGITKPRRKINKIFSKKQKKIQIKKESNKRMNDREHSNDDDFSHIIHLFICIVSPQRRDKKYADEKSVCWHALKWL